MAPFHAWPVLAVTLTVLVWLIDGICVARGGGWRLRLRRAATVGWWFGFGYFLVGLYWTGHAFLVDAERFAWLLPFAISMLPAGMGLYYALAAALAVVLWRPGAARVIGFALAIFAAEYLRGTLFGGFPWIALGYGLAAGDAMMQGGSLIGLFGLTLIAAAAFASPAALWGPAGALDVTARGRAALPALMALLLVAAGLWGQHRLASADSGAVPGVRLRIMQPNIPQSEKWRDNSRNWVFETYLDVSRYGTGAKGPDPLAGVTHLIWPESAFPFLLEQTPSALESLAELLPAGAVFVTGAMRAEPDASLARGFRVYNSVFVMDEEAKILAVYDKTHLVPFGEYLPFQSAMEAIGIAQLTGIEGGFDAGRGPRLMRAPGGPAFAPLICYEIVFPGAALDAAERPGWMINLTNDGWFGRSTGPYQHLHQARLRAVEEGLPVVRVANTGVSAVIDAHGRLLASLPLGRAGAFDSDLPQAIAPPPYARWPRLIELAVAVAAFFAWLSLAKRRFNR